MIHKEQMQTKHSDVINIYSLIVSYFCSLDLHLYCLGLYRPCFAFLLWLLNQSLQLDSVLTNVKRAEEILIMFCYKLHLYFIALISIGVSVHSDDKEQMEDNCM